MVLVICLCLFIPLRSTTAVNVSFLGTTNDSAGGLVFLLCASNTSDYEIRFWNFPPEIKKSGGWTPLHPIAGMVSQINVPPHSAYTFSETAIPAGAVWRIPIDWAYDKSFTIEYARRFLIDNVNRNLRLLSQGKAPGLNGGNHLQMRLIYSQEVTNH